MLTAKSYAKLNLTLRIGPRRDDGFHPLESLVAPIDLADEVTVSAAPPGEFRLEIPDSPASAGIPTDDANLALRAARRLSQASGAGAGARIRIVKHIPAGAGLGGGSSNAATTLRLLSELWRLPLEMRELMRIGAELGSDVPLFLHPGPAIITGRGERIEPLSLRCAPWAVVLMPDIECPTGAVYAAFDELPPPPIRLSPRYFATTIRSPQELMQATYNDLERAAFVVRPALAHLVKRLTTGDWPPFRMTGSGSAFFTLLPEAKAADELARKLGSVAGVRSAAVRVHARADDAMR